MKYDVYGMGNALVDSEFEVSDAFLQEQVIEKGLMTLIDEAHHHQLLNKLQTQFGLKKRTGGGSAANTTVAVSQFGAKTYYACKVADDEFGRFYRQDLQDAGVDNALELLGQDGHTGKCMVMVTPDTERTMNTYLGITADFSKEELDLDKLRQSHYMYAEGYLVTSDISRAAVMAARQVARASQVKTALSFSDPSMVTYFKAGIEEILDEGVDLLFSNEEEACIFADTSDLEVAIAALKPRAKKLVITQGKKGALVVSDRERTAIAPYPVTALDSNGAGDMFAGAFLYGMVKGMSDAKAGELASLSASALVTRFGTRLSTQDHQTILNQVLA